MTSELSDYELTFHHIQVSLNKFLLKNEPVLNESSI